MTSVDKKEMIFLEKFMQKKRNFRIDTVYLNCEHVF